MNLEQLKKEEKELEEQVFGKKEEDHSDESLEDQEVESREDDSTEDDDEEDLSHATDSGFSEESEEDEEDSDSEEEESVQKTQRTNWKKRFTNYKASTDNTIFLLRREISELKEQAASLININKEMRSRIESVQKVDPLDAAISQDDEDLIGPEAAEIMRRAVKAATEPLQRKIRTLEDAEEQKVVKEASRAKSDSINLLKQKLSKYVENFESIDLDPKFGKYLEEEDEYSGVPRRSLFSRAIKNGDVGRVAAFYKDFASKRPARKEDILGKKISPVGRSSESSEGTSSSKKKIYTMKDYTDTYDRYLRGGFKTEKEKNDLIDKMKLLDKAFMEGRLRG